MTDAPSMAGKYMPVTGGIGKATATGPAAMASPPVIRAAPRLPSTSFGAEDHAAHLGIIIRVARPLMKSPSQGPLTTVYLASSPEVEGGTGQYIAHRKPKASSKASYDTAAAARPWQTSAALTGPDRGRIAINSGTSTSDGPGAQAKRPVGDLRQLLPRPDEQSPDYNRLARRQNARSGDPDCRPDRRVRAVIRRSASCRPSGSLACPVPTMAGVRGQQWGPAASPAHPPRLLAGSPW